MLDIRYLAGLFDGEGCVHIPVQRRIDLRVPNYGIRAVFCLTHREIIREIAEQYKVGHCKLNKSASNAKWADAYQVQICGNKAASFFRDILPYSIVKKQCIEIALLLQDDIARYRRSDWMRFNAQEMQAIIEYREGLRLQLKALNARGGASVGMIANSVDLLCPASNGAEGQSRAKQERAA
jgi:hypothetical protein